MGSRRYVSHHERFAGRAEQVVCYRPALRRRLRKHALAMMQNLMYATPAEASSRSDFANAGPLSVRRPNHIVATRDGLGDSLACSFYALPGSQLVADDVAVAARPRKLLCALRGAGLRAEHPEHHNYRFGRFHRLATDGAGRSFHKDSLADWTPCVKWAGRRGE